MNNQLIDYVIRIKNAALAKRKKVVSSYSKTTNEIGKLLVKEGFLDEITVVKDGGVSTLVSTIKYQNKLPVLIGLEIVSKPSKRVYISKTDIQQFERRGRVTGIISTSKGLMTGKRAIREGWGGEVLIKIW